MKTKSEVIKLMKEGTHCILVDTNTNVQTDLLEEICNELEIEYKAPSDLVFKNYNQLQSYIEIKLSSIQKDEIEPDNEKANDSEYFDNENFAIVETKNEKPYLFYEGEKYYFGEDYE